MLFVLSIGPSCFNNTAQHRTAPNYTTHAHWVAGLRLAFVCVVCATRCNHAAGPPAAVPDVTMKFAKELERDLVPGELTCPCL